MELMHRKDLLQKESYKNPELLEKIKYMFKVFGKPEGSDF